MTDSPADPFRGFSADALRARFRPPRRIARPLLALVPWADVALLALAFAFFGQATALVPGEWVDLPETAFHAGAVSSLVVVVRARPGAPDAAAAADAPVADAFFRDERFSLAGPGRADALRDALRVAAAESGEDTAVVYLDASLAHRDALWLCSLLRDAGLRHVLFAARPSVP